MIRCRALGMDDRKADNQKVDDRTHNDHEHLSRCHEGRPPRTSLKSDGWPSLASLCAFIEEGLDALDIDPPRYIKSIFGSPRTWPSVYRSRFGELHALNIWRPMVAFKTIFDILIPAIPATPPSYGPEILQRRFWRPTLILQRPDHHGSWTSFPNESWLFINGVVTNDAIAQIEAGYLAHLFHRPVTLIQNATDSIWLDVIEALLDRHHRLTEPIAKAFPVIYDALKRPDKDRVIVICHSQGSMIMANVLRLMAELCRVREEETEEAGRSAQESILAAAAGTLDSSVGVRDTREPVFVFPEPGPLRLSDFEPLTRAELSKLEVYSFATCARYMRYIVPQSGSESSARASEAGVGAALPFIEHFGNELDIVARLGMLSPRPVHWNVQIDGERYMRAGAWGHMLVANYLRHIEVAQKDGHRPGGRGTQDPYINPTSTAVPRLYHYINGGTPPPYTEGGARP